MKNFNPNLYDILGLISRHATAAELKEAYRTLAKHYHPDKNPDDKVGAEERMKKLNEAYDILKDPKKRDEYNAMLLQHDATLRRKEEERVRREAEEKRRKAAEEAAKKKVKFEFKQKPKPVMSNSDGAALGGVILGIAALGLLFAALSDDE